MKRIASALLAVLFLLTGLVHPASAEAASRSRSYSSSVRSVRVSIPKTTPVRVKAYTKKNGTYVAPHYRTAPNRTKADNYSTKGNYNPYTGKVGTKKLTY